MTADTIPVAPLSIWEPVHLGTDELGHRVEVTLAERNMLIGGEPGGGKSVALQLIVAHGALSADCRLILVDGKRVELGLWKACADRFIGPSVDDAINRDIVARGRAPGIIPVEATQRPSADIIPTSLRDLFGYRWAFRCSTEASSDTILGHGWANQGYSATEIDPQARGVGWLRAEDGIPRRVKAAYLTDEEIIYLADWAAQARATHHAGDHADDAGKVVQLLRKDDAA